MEQKKKKGGLKVYKTCCGNCLLSKDSIVSPARRKGIINDCVENQTHFLCHKSTIAGTEIICKTFFDKLGQHSQMIRIAKTLNMIEEVEQPNSKKLMSYAEMKSELAEDDNARVEILTGK